LSALLDTHAVLWWKGDERRLSRRALRAIEDSGPLLLSPISIWEISTLLRLGRIELDRDLFTWVRDLLDGAVEIASLSAAAAAEAGRWTAEEFHGDPADRLIYATALDLRVPLVSKDRRLHDFAAARGDVRVLW